MLSVNKFIRASEIEKLLGAEKNSIWRHISYLLSTKQAGSAEFVGTYQDFFVTEAGLVLLASESQIEGNKEKILEIVELFYEGVEQSPAVIEEEVIEETMQLETYVEDGITFIKQDDSFLTSTREVAEHFNKRHADVLRSINNILENDSAQDCVQFFSETYYRDSSGKMNKEYLLDKDGFMLLVMGFSGKEALKWKIKYIRAFNKMAEYIQSQLITIDNLPPITKALLQLEQNQIEMQQQIKKTNDKMKTLNATLLIGGDTAKEDIAKTINRLVALSGRTHQDFRRETYELLEAREHVKLETRLLNAKKRAIKAGETEAKANQIKKIDIICNDKRLLSAYKNILTQMTVTYDIAQ